MFDISPLLMQLNSTLPVVVAPPTTTDIGTTITALIVAIGGVMGALAAIMQSIGNRKGLEKQKVGIQEAAVRLQEVGKHMIDSKQDIESLAQILYGFFPDKAQTIVNQQNVRLAELAKKLEEAKAKLDKIPPALDHI